MKLTDSSQTFVCLVIEEFLTAQYQTQINNSGGGLFQVFFHDLGGIGAIVCDNDIHVKVITCTVSKRGGERSLQERELPSYSVLCSKCLSNFKSARVAHPYGRFVSLREVLKTSLGPNGYRIQNFHGN